jgi:hypothetical protein
LFPSFQQADALFGRYARIVRQIIHRPAERIENHHVLPPLAGQDVQGESQIRLRLAGDFRGGGHGFSG